MFRTCLLTDSTVLFTKPTYAGVEHVHVIPNSPQTNLAPSPEAFRQSFSKLAGSYQEVIVILGSSHLSAAVKHAQQAVNELKSPLNVQVLDSQTTAVGLGLLVQAAAESIQHGIPAQEICNQIRGMLRNIFTIFCLPDLSHLARSGQIDPAQAVVGEMLGLIPIYIMENGKLIHSQKIRSPRHLVDVLMEFVMEFDQLRFLALLQGAPLFQQECRHLHERINQSLHTPHMCEYALTPALSALLGPRAIGVISLQKSRSEIL